MVFSSRRIWKNITTVFLTGSKGRAFVDLYLWLSVKLLASIINAHFCLSVRTWKMIGTGMEKSDAAICFGGTLLPIECIIWKPSKIYSCRNSLSGWFICCNNWLRSSSYSSNNSFAASIYRWCGIHKRWFSAWVCSDEKNFRELLLQLYRRSLYLCS